MLSGSLSGDQTFYLTIPYRTSSGFYLTYFPRFSLKLYLTSIVTFTRVLYLALLGNSTSKSGLFADLDIEICDPEL